MSHRFDHLQVADGDLVLAKDMPDALTAATLVFADGATQVFTADGKTTYVEHGRPTQGEVTALTAGTSERVTSASAGWRPRSCRLV